MISPSTNLKLLFLSKDSMFCFLPVEKLSRHITSTLRAKSSSQRLLPINPAPPVTKIFLQLKKNFQLKMEC